MQVVKKGGHGITGEKNYGVLLAKKASKNTAKSREC